MKKVVRRPLILSVCALVILSVTGSAFAQTGRERNAKKPEITEVA